MHDIHVDSQQFKELTFESDQRDEPNMVVEVHEQVDVTRFGVFPSCDAAEQSNVPDAVPLTHLQDCASVPSKSAPHWAVRKALGHLRQRRSADLESTTCGIQQFLEHREAWLAMSVLVSADDWLRYARSPTDTRRRLTLDPTRNYQPRQK